MRDRKNLKKAQAALKEFTQSNQVESQGQADFVSRFRKSFPGVLIFSIPNGTNAGPREKSRLKTQGLVIGVPDLMIPAWGLFIEMKQTTGGKTSPEQIAVIAYLESVGYSISVAHGADEAMAFCEQFSENLNNANTDHLRHANMPKGIKTLKDGLTGLEDTDTDATWAYTHDKEG